MLGFLLFGRGTELCCLCPLKICFVLESSWNRSYRAQNVLTWEQNMSLAFIYTGSFILNDIQAFHKWYVYCITNTSPLAVEDDNPSEKIGGENLRPRTLGQSPTLTKNTVGFLVCVRDWIKLHNSALLQPLKMCVCFDLEFWFDPLKNLRLYICFALGCIIWPISYLTAFTLPKYWGVKFWAHLYTDRTDKLILKIHVCKPNYSIWFIYLRRIQSSVISMEFQTWSSLQWLFFLLEVSLHF